METKETRKGLMETEEPEVNPQLSGFSVGSKENPIFISKGELPNVGCMNCVWKSISQCPYELKGTESYPVDVSREDLATHEVGVIDGICPEMISFLGTLAQGQETSSGLWEQFHLYKARLQENTDYADYLRLNQIIGKMEADIQKNGLTKELHDRLEDLKMKRTSAKIWWSKLNEHIVGSMQKVNDRTAKKVETPRLPGIYGAKTVNFNISAEKPKQLEE